MKQFNYRNGFYIDYDDSAVERNRFKILYKSIRAVIVAISESETDYWLDLSTILAAPNGDSDMGSNELELERTWAWTNEQLKGVENYTSVYIYLYETYQMVHF